MIRIVVLSWSLESEAGLGYLASVRRVTRDKKKNKETQTGREHFKI